MGIKEYKKARRIARKVQEENTQDIIVTWFKYQLEKPLRQRIKFAWIILRGRRYKK